MEKYLNPSLNASVRAGDLLSRMTFEEKVAQMTQLSMGHISWEEAEMWAAERGIGSFLHAVGDEVCRLQAFAKKSRLGVPLLMGIDAIHGHAIHNGCTVFPTPIALACSFNQDTARKVAKATAAEVSVDGLHWVFSPLLCQGRDLRWGRIGETFGEDAYLIGEMATAMVEGYQGDDLSHVDSVIACLKHYIAYGEAVGGRDATDAFVTYRKIRETFLPPFAKAVKAGAGSVMTAYQSIDGVPCTINHDVMNKMLREELGFDGILTTDWNNLENLVKLQHVCADLKDATLKTLETTHDYIMCTPDFYDTAIQLHEEGKLSDDALDASVLRILIKKIELGLFDVPEKTPEILCSLSSERMDEHKALALESARESMVLLKNKKNLLPLTGIKSMALIGPASDSVRSQFGDWTFFTHPSPDETRKPTFHVSTFKDALESACEKRNIKFTHHKGCDFLGEWSDIPAAVEAAKDKDVIVCCLGDCLIQTGEIHDRSNLELSGKQNELISALAATGKPVVGIFSATKPLVLNVMEENSQALICTFSCGQAGGNALSGLLFGECDFTGRLPISFPRATGQLPVYYNQLPGWHIDRYMDCEPTPLFTFGEGLNYTTFAYDKLSAQVQGNAICVTARVTNTGKRSGTDIVQCYVHDLVSSIVQPIRKLAAFTHATLDAGEAKTISISLPMDAFSLVDLNQNTVVEPGEFEILLGASSKESDLIKTIITL